MARAGTTATGVVLVGTMATRRRRDLLKLLDRLNPTITELSQVMEQEAEVYFTAQQLMGP